MITTANYFQQINSVDLANAPEALKQGHSLFSRATSEGANMDAYKSNATIQRVVDSYIEKLNAWNDSQQKEEKVTLTDQQKKDITKYKEDIEKFADQKPAKKPRVRTNPNSNPEDVKKAIKAVKKLKETEKSKPAIIEPAEAKHQVEKIPPSVAFINRYRKMQGKMIPLRLRKGERGVSLTALLAALQKMIVEKVVTKTDKYADELYAIQKTLTKLIKGNKGYPKVKVELDKYPEYMEIVSSYAIKSITKLAKRFIALQGKEGVKDEANKLLNAIGINIKAGTVTVDQTHDMVVSLTQYTEGKTTTIEVSEATLNGLHGIAGISHTSKETIKKKFKEAGAKAAYRLKSIPSKKLWQFCEENTNLLNTKEKSEACDIVMRSYMTNTPVPNLYINIIEKEMRNKRDRDRRTALKKALAGIDTPAHTPDIEEVEVIETIVPETATVKPKINAKDLPDIIGSETLRDLEFEKMGFTGKWLKIIGDPVFPFSMMIHAKPGRGKSSLAIELCYYLATDHNQRILYISKDEGNKSYTMQEKFERLNAFHPNIDISNGVIPKNINDYDFVVFDLMNDFDFDYKDFKFDYIEKYKHTDKKTGFFAVFKATADGQFRGNKDWENMFDVSLQINDEGFAQASKNRFGAFGVIKYLQTMSEKVYKFATMQQAETFKTRTLKKDGIELVIVDGNDGRIWAVSKPYAAVLAEQGFTVHSPQIAAANALNGANDDAGERRIKTDLPEAITSVQQAQQFLLELDRNDESYDPTQNAHDLANNPFTYKECDQLNKLMLDIHKLPGNFDAYDFVAGLRN